MPDEEIQPLDAEKLVLLQQAVAAPLSECRERNSRAHYLTVRALAVNGTVSIRTTLRSEDGDSLFDLLV
jgi:hypothetical protein